MHDAIWAAFIVGGVFGLGLCFGSLLGVRTAVETQVNHAFKRAREADIPVTRQAVADILRYAREA